MKNKEPKPKSSLHPKNKHQGRYNLKELIVTQPSLADFVSPNGYGDDSIDFFNPEAVKALNTALLMHYYDITYWEIPENYLCPPIPGRADYIHHIAQLLSENNYGNVPTGNKIICLDVGVGANCIYPLVGNKEYGWSFIGSDIDNKAIANAQKIVDENGLKESISLRLQENPKDVFYGVLPKEEQIDITICNPPFHASAEEANKGTQRKLNNLKGKQVDLVKNFGGQHSELWCDGGQNKINRNMVKESKKFSTSCFWFTTLVSKQSNLKSIYNALDKEAAKDVVTIAMGQGNKSSRIVAWTFLSPEQQVAWRNDRWK